MALPFPRSLPIRIGRFGRVKVNSCSHLYSVSIYLKSMASVQSVKRQSTWLGTYALITVQFLTALPRLALH